MDVNFKFGDGSDKRFGNFAYTDDTTFQNIFDSLYLGIGKSNLGVWIEYSATNDQRAVARVGASMLVRKVLQGQIGVRVFFRALIMINNSEY